MTVCADNRMSVSDCCMWCRCLQDNAFDYDKALEGFKLIGVVSCWCLTCCIAHLYPVAMAIDNILADNTSHARGHSIL